MCNMHCTGTTIMVSLRALRKGHIAASCLNDKLD